MAEKRYKQSGSMPNKHAQKYNDEHDRDHELKNNQTVTQPCTTAIARKVTFHNQHWIIAA